MIYLNAGNLWSQDYLDKVVELNDKYGGKVYVKSLFGSIAKLTPTARAADRLPYRDWFFMDKYIANAIKHGIQIRYTLNASCIDSLQEFKRNWDAKLKGDVVELHNIGVREWTITSPLLIELVRGMFSDDLIEVSTIYEMATPQEALHLLKLGANGANLSTSVNRKPGAIFNIMRVAKAGLTISILANEACLFRCPWRRECYNLSSHDSQRSDDLFGSYPFSRCNNYRIEHPVEWVKSRMVLPSWMALYQREFGIDWFKIAYRTHPYDVSIPILEYYMKQEDPANLLDLWPTIAQLGHTKEPKSVYMLSTESYTREMLAKFLKLGDRCDSEVCGETCKECYKMTVSTIEYSTPAESL